MRKIYLLLLICVPLILAGCFESKESYVLNPDGSGKVTILGSFETGMPGMPASTDPKETKKQIKELFEKSKGVDAWSNVSYERTKEGRISFKGTAYFPDLDALDIDTFGKKAALSKDGNKLVLLLEEDSEKPEQAASKLTEADLKAQIEQTKKEWQQMKTMMGPMLSKIKQELTYKLPGSVESTINMKKLDASTVNIQMDGAKFMSAMDAKMSDDAWLKKQAQAGHLAPGGSGPPMDEEINGIVFGEKGPIKAVLAADAKPQFDYKKEMTAAKAEHTKLMEQLAKDAQ